MHSQAVGVQKLSLSLKLSLALVLVPHMSHLVKFSLPNICTKGFRGTFIHSIYVYSKQKRKKIANQSLILTLQRILRTQNFHQVIDSQIRASVLNHKKAT